ncbi:uncharacterized protein H6S33_008503 [Morchella sextelata]|uniref:uncharacterized protein n=1 Tax=Morchella sextelata TaxID=1174677 RepID=UPI001D04EEDE|nr:uncharacterized protein H6S33_008503 [Morchella sextelata]KAH0602853.1 hypothetical protein H6S33_008503 [Morchella sextelata]
MSIFGDSPPPAARSRSSLFDDDFTTATPGSGSLFDDSGPDPWATGLPVPRRGADSDITKTLLTPENASIPEEYVDYYDALLAQYAAPNGISVEGVGKILLEAGVDSTARERIWGVIMRGGKESVGRDEVNVLLAMIGLAQEGDEISIDGVDYRRRNLPIPRFTTIVARQHHRGPGVETPTTSLASSTHKSANTAPHSVHDQSQDQPTSPSSIKPLIVHRQQSTPISTSPIRTRTSKFVDEVEDPWGSSPAVVQSHTAPPVVEAPVSVHQTSPTAERTNSFNYQPSASARPASTHVRGDSHGRASSLGRNEPYSSPTRIRNQIDDSELEPDDIHSALRNNNANRTSASSAWGAYEGGPHAETGGYNPSLFSEPSAPARHGSFGGLGGTTIQSESGVPSRGPEEVVTVSVLPEKEGMFMFQHRNYQIASARRGSRVVRRYSDFVWLLECLHKRYPFRQLPLLPPKRLAVNGHYLSADAAFVERRRRGLFRFANALVRHPVLSQEQLVIMFLTVPTELTVWRKQTTISMQEEFAGKPLPPGLEDSLPVNLEQTFDTVRSGLRKSSEIYIQLCSLLERLEKRNEGIAADYLRFSLALRSLTDCSEATYAVDTNEIPLLNNGLLAVSQHLSNCQTLLEDETKAWDAGILEDLKRQRDCLVSMRELFDRKERLAVDNVPQLERRIKTSQAKLEALRNKPEGTVKPGERERVEESIVRDKASIVEMLNRRVFVKECVRDELIHFQSSQYHVSRLHQDWSQERVKYAELQADNWRALCNEVEEMPLGE